MAKQIIVTQNDYGIELETQFVDDKKKPLDITDYDVRVKIIYDDKTIDTVLAGHKDSVNGIAYIVLEKEHLINAGLHTSVWSVVDEDEHVTAQENVYYFVKDVEGSEDDTPTTDLPIDADGVLNKFNEIDNNLFELTEQGNVVNEEIDSINETLSGVNEQLEQNVEQISYINTNKSYWVSPEDFGCKGNGVIDDTVNLQKAITYCYENKKTLKCKDNSIYCISNTLQILDYIDIEMNNSIIKAIQPMDKMINYKFPEDYRNYKNNTNLGKMSYSSLHLDGNNMAKYGIYIEDGVCITFYNTKIRFASIGIHIHSASELLFDNIYVRCNPTDNNSIGVENLANDCLFNMIYIMDAHVGILNNGLNHMSKVHVWKGSNFNGSIGIKFMGGNLFLDSSYIDSYANAFYIGASSQLMINNCNTFYNGAMYTDKFDTPIIFFLSDTTKDMMGYSSITNCFIKGKNSNTKLSNVDNLRVHEVNNSFNNLDMTYVSKLNTKDITLTDGIIKNSDSTTGCAFVSFENATRYIYINIEKTSGFSQNDSIGTLPFTTTQSFVVPCLISANQYFNGVVEHAILVINKTGDIIVKTNSTLTPKYLTANFTLPSGSFR